MATASSNVLVVNRDSVSRAGDSDSEYYDDYHDVARGSLQSERGRALLGGDSADPLRVRELRAVRSSRQSGGGLEPGSDTACLVCGLSCVGRYCVEHSGRTAEWSG
jgi:hypothetical protein